CVRVTSGSYYLEYLAFW
nr:immunoglobulin heavy chain junction region [Macaca mulatta]